METNLPGIYAVGDVVGGYQLAHVASAEGVVAAANAAGLEEKNGIQSGTSLHLYTA
ncbi:hypothetical protein GCM10020331_013430 [Ectobacillus funiculus]